ncbi:Conserved protein of unknown function [Magnetospira sp. QH-2]|nr:Conserved protein of unknown function [Magnetospira sp. QH-2]
MDPRQQKDQAGIRQPQTARPDLRRSDLRKPDRAGWHLQSDLVLTNTGPPFGVALSYRKGNSVNTEIIQIDYDTWRERYRPIHNEFDKNAPFEGAMFETYGEELCFVRSCSPEKIWTLLDGEDARMRIGSGFHLVNRIGYFITNDPVPNGTSIEIMVD